MNNYNEEQVKIMLDKNSEYYNVEINKLREVIDNLKEENARLQIQLEEMTDASAVVLTESLRYQEVLHAIMEVGPSSPGDKKHLMAKDALEGITND